MKSLKKYLEKQGDEIDTLLKKPKEAYTPETFHKLRVEIKKLNACFELINFCSKDFKRKNTFKPFKLIFRQAGRIRELQIEEATLKKYFLTNMLKGYRNNLKQVRLKEKEKYFSIVNKKFAAQLKKTIYKMEPFIMQVDKRKVNSYTKEKRKIIEKIIQQKTLKTPQLHLLRKELKKFNFNQRSLGLKKANETLPKKDVLPELLGKWHDCQVIIEHLKKAMETAEMNPKERSQLEKVKTKISSESDEFLNKINATIPTSEFFSAQC